MYKIHLVHVLTSIPAEEYTESGENELKEEASKIKDQENSDVLQFARKLVTEGYEVEVSSYYGLVKQTLVEVINTLQPAMIMMVTSGSADIIEDAFGTDTYHIFEKTSAPMLIIPSDASLVGIKNAVVGLHLDNEQEGVIKEFMGYADEMHLHTQFVKIDDHFQLDIIDDKGVLAHLQKTYPGKLENIVYKREDDIAKGLEKYAREHNADLIVLFTTKRDFFEKIFHKSVTRDLILHSKKPLLIYHY